jgi:Fe-S cluster biosynthesis and repair protein YggX
MKHGILVYNQVYQEWRVWVGQQAYLIDQGYLIELRINNRYFQAFLEKDYDWFVTLDGDVSFMLHHHEVYKVRIRTRDFCPELAPF